MCVAEWGWGGRFPLHQQAMLPHQVGVLPFNSVLTLSTDSTDPQVKALVSQDWPEALLPRLQMPVTIPGYHLCF